MSSSEESNDEDADSLDPLPTPSSLRMGSIGGEVGSGPSFTDPWAVAGAGAKTKTKPEVDNQHGMGIGGLDVDFGEERSRGSTDGRGGRPPLETIPSDDTERG